MTIPAVATARSLLFVPGDDAKKMERAWSSGADAVVLDLEDAVLPERKVSARQRVCATLRQRGPAPLRIVRVNGLDTAWGADDLGALESSDVDAVMLPKATGDGVAHLSSVGVPVIALIETAAGLRAAHEIACHPRVQALALGGADLGAELGWIPRPDGLELLHARSVLVLDSAASGLRPPFDVVQLATRDDAALAAEIAMARSLGMGGKLCIHPAQVDAVNAGFSPTPAEVAHAENVLAAWSAASSGDGSGVAVLNGKLVDLPVASRARATLALAQTHHTSGP
jgi:citrate lyase beta subunit